MLSIKTLIYEVALGLRPLKNGEPGLANVQDKAIEECIRILTGWFVVEGVLKIDKKCFDHVGFKDFYELTSVIYRKFNI